MTLKNVIDKGLVESFYLKKEIDNSESFMYVQYFIKDLKKGKDSIDSKTLNKEIKMIRPFEESILFILGESECYILQ
jgi:hypothetical protein